MIFKWLGRLYRRWRLRKLNGEYHDWFCFQDNKPPFMIYSGWVRPGGDGWVAESKIGSEIKDKYVKNVDAWLAKKGFRR